jgi:hypothetical protein
VKLLLLQPCTLMEEEEDLSVVPARFVRRIWFLLAFGERWFLSLIREK